MNCYKVIRSPNGAIPTDTEVEFKIFVSRDVKNVKLVLIHDENTVYEHHKMNVIYRKVNENKFEYTTKVKFNHIGLTWYYFILEDDLRRVYVGKGNKSTEFIECENEPKSWQITTYMNDFKTPNWIKGSVIYHIFVDRFNIGDKPHFKKYAIPLRTNRKPLSYSEGGDICFYGGNIKGIIEKIDYFEKLGVTCLYLSPIFKARSNHKYDTSDYEQLDSAYGTEKDFKELCDKAHKRGMHIILDGVFNHVGVDSKYFKDEKYKDWFTFRDDGSYECWWDFASLPSIKKNTPKSFNDYINGNDGIIRKWLSEGADGWRLDVADELSNEFLESLRRAAKSEKEDAIIIGEVWENASNKHAYGHRRKYLYGTQLDSVMNYPFRVGIIDYLNSGNATRISNNVDDIINTYPMDVVHCLMNNIGTHDTARILTELHGDKNKVKQAFVMLFTLPGNPCIYYGDEMYMEGGKDPQNRGFFEENEENLVDFIANLSKIRALEDVFKYGKYKLLTDENGIYSYKRYTDDNQLTVIINNSGKIYELPCVQYDFITDKFITKIENGESAIF